MNADFRIRLSNAKTQWGLSLVEMMIALTVGLLVMAGMFSLLLGNNQIYRANDGVARMQENARFAVDAISNDIRMAGFTGCAPTATVVNLLNNAATPITPTTWWENFGNPGAATTAALMAAGSSYTIMGYDGNDPFPGRATGSAGGDRSSPIGWRTDAITLLQGGGNQYFVTSHSPAARTFTLNQTAGLEKGKVVVVCDAQQASIIQLTSNPTGNVVPYAAGTNLVPGNSAATLNHTYKNDAVMVEYTPVAFYIGVSNSNPTSIPTPKSLYRMSLQTISGTPTMVPEELVENVESMQIYYGVDTSTPADDTVDPPYLSAANVTNWSRVLSVRVKFLLKSANDGLVDTKQKLFFPVQGDKSNDTTAGGEGECGGQPCLEATDYRLYQPLSTTVGLRNRLN